MNRLPAYLLLLSGFLLASTVHAEQKVLFDGYEVHYATLLTSDLTAEVAKTYNIPRSSKRAYVMIHTRKLLIDNSSESVPVVIEGQVSNMLGQIRALKWQQVKEEDSIYSLSHFPITNREWATFKIKITPQDATQSLPLEFKQQFYTD